MHYQTMSGWPLGLAFGPMFYLSDDLLSTELYGPNNYQLMLACRGLFDVGGKALEKLPGAAEQSQLKCMLAIYYTCTTVSLINLLITYKSELLFDSLFQCQRNAGHIMHYH